MERILCLHKQLRITTASLFMIPVFLLCRMVIYAQDADMIKKQEAFEQFFGDAVTFDPAMVEKIKLGTPGKRYYADKNNDGKPEEVWFIDIAPRHTEKKRPILVKVIDEDGDLEMGKEPDRDADLWVADWNANGLVDAAVDYEDLDGDQDIDQIGMYFYDGRYGLRVWWSRDDGDDNQLWYDVDYIYDQSVCQYKSHFGGDETFCSFYYAPEKNYWVPFSENPFLFYDCNQDEVTEEVIRIAGERDLIRSVRWSFDADNDGTKKQPRNFDAGISAFAPGWTPESNNSNLYIGERESEIVTLRGVAGGPILKRQAAPGYLRQVVWGRVLLTWDEIDLNRAWNNPGDTIDRWEGVIAAPSFDSIFYMPKIGGPVCSPYNKRYELVLKPEVPNEFYFNPADQRIHIKNCDKAWINVDYNGDDRSDMYYNWVDRDDDGILDFIEIDIDSDGIIDDSWRLSVSDVKSVSWTFEGLNTIYEPVIVYEPAKKYQLSKTLVAALESIGSDAEEDPVWALLQQNMKGGNFTGEVTHKLNHSDETMLYYWGLICDRQICRLKKLHKGSSSFWKAFYAARSENDVKSMIGILCKEFNLDTLGQDYQEWLQHRRKKTGYQRVAWNDKWFPPNWCWESEEAAFRFYDGHFDLFAKRLKMLIIPDFTKITRQNYHLDRNEWGMDILEAGKSGGCGGLTLYVNGIAYPVRTEPNESGPTFTGRLVEETSDKVTIELFAQGIVPEKPYTVKIRPSALAGREDSPVEIIVEGGSLGETIEVGIGLTRLHDETFMFDQTEGIMGNWGFQNPEIGWIGMGVIFQPGQFIRIDEQPNEHRVVLQCEIGKPLTYHIQYRWLKGMRFSCCPVAKDWMDTLEKTTEELSKM